MRSIILIAPLLAALLSTGASAQQHWTPAPVPNVRPTERVAPAERAGRASGPDRGAPLSDLPTGATTTGGATSANQGDGVGTPSLSR
jgi:hypothetical protein